MGSKKEKPGIWGRFLLLILVVAAFATLLSLLKTAPILPEEIRLKYVEYFKYIGAIASLAIGYFVVSSLSSIITSRLKDLGPSALLVKNVVMILGYITVAIVALSFFEVTGMLSLAGATFSGLIVGFGLQPVMANFFAGLILLGTGHLKPGYSVKISGTSLPISTVSFPAYKLFSINEYVPSITGTVVEVGLMFTKVLSTHGELVKIPNNLLLTSSIVREEVSEEKKVRIRYELPLSCDPELSLKELEREFSSDKGVELYLEEQSDKLYYIVVLTATVPPHEKLMKFRSLLLMKLIKVHRSLMRKGICEELKVDLPPNNE
jgi:small-conductance mechanosensitive channel